MVSYGDESYDETKTRTFAVAALLGYEDDWRELEAAWTVRTGGMIVHAADCDSDHGDFRLSATRTHNDNQNLYHDLARVLAESRIGGLGKAMDVGAFTELFRGMRRDQPYFMCLEWAIVKLADWLQANAPTEQVQFTYDRNREAEFNAEYIYDGLLIRPEWDSRHRLSDTWSTATRKNPRIQMADLFARETMKELDRQSGRIDMTSASR